MARMLPLAAVVLALGATAFIAPQATPTSTALGARRSARSAPQAAKASSLTGSSVGLGLAAVSVGLALARCSLTQRRLRLAGKDIPRNKELAYALICSVYGVGKTTAFKICVDTALDPHKIVNELSEEEERAAVED
ncbi:unnamed protein product, partial [Effrenium voratum]